MEHKTGLLVVLVILVSNTQLSIAQGESSTSCVSSLSPCMRFLNSTRDPPDSCCEPLKDVIQTNQQCLCRMISTQGAFQAQLVGINISEVEMLPERCGLRVNPLACLKGSSGSRNSLQNSAAAHELSFPSLILLAFGVLLMITVI